MKSLGKAVKKRKIIKYSDHCVTPEKKVKADAALTNGAPHRAGDEDRR
ncbi:hypothetical protein SNE26_20400 [Mucilaginibacter sp. cycad4]|nr:hypothetical protein [Mucilaginibacter gossypii]WPU98390.1 hypothetical protein SNE26_20400 [Mucilaginibacter gossypii]